MCPDKVDDDTRDSIIEAIKEGDRSQEEIADDHGVSQATVSNIKRSHDRGRERGKEEGRKEGFKEAAKTFSKSDNTDKPDDDNYWCAYCESEEGEKVSVEYMQEKCPNGHDLSGDW